jgi:hypothetical protein
MWVVVSAVMHTDSEGDHSPRDTLLVEAVEAHIAVGLLLPLTIQEQVLTKLYSENTGFSNNNFS